MALSRDRIILGITSIVLFLITSYLIFSAPHSCNLISAIVLSFNAAILFSWTGFGMVAGIIIFILSFLAALAGVLRSGCYNAAYMELSFFIAVLIGYNHWKLKRRREYSFRLHSEKLDEEINILSDDIHKKKIEIKHHEERLLRYMVLKDVAEALTTTLTLEDIAKLIIERTMGTLKKSGRSLLFLVDMEKQELMLSASQGAAKVRAKKGDIFDLWVLKHSLPLIVEDVSKDFRFSSTAVNGSKESIRSLIITPLLSGNKVIGLLRVDSEQAGLYTQDDLRLLDIIGGLGAVAIQNSFLYSWIQDLAIRDSLTGLFVRRYFLKRFQEEIQRAARKGAHLSLLMLDIDRFKWYNDKFGHATGDLVLKHITAKISSALQEGDIVSRYGGEEIAILLAGSEKAKAVKIAESIRKKIEDEPLIIRREKYGVTVSIGVSSYPEDAVIDQDLVRIADSRLYNAKESGRNRTCGD